MLVKTSKISILFLSMTKDYVQMYFSVFKKQLWKPFKLTFISLKLYYLQIWFLKCTFKIKYTFKRVKHTSFSQGVWVKPNLKIKQSRAKHS